jgi:glycosyltransferase involved in cell wall biosynthesis
MQSIDQIVDGDNHQEHKTFKMPKREDDRNGMLAAWQSSRTPVSVILPSYNEQAAVAMQVRSVRRVLSSYDIRHEIIVVDDGSEDETAAEARNARARVLRHAQNRGYGASIKTGIMAAEYDTIVIIDADGTYPSDQIPNLLAKLETADMVVGARTGKEVHIPRIRRPAKWLLGRLASQIAGQAIPDLNSGLRAFRRQCVKPYFPILSNRFSFTTTVTLALLADDYRVVYHEIDYYQRIGRSKITPRHFMDFIILVLRMSMLFHPLKVFVPLAFSCGLLAVLKIIYDVLALFARHSVIGWYLLYEPVLSTSAILLLLTMFQLLLIGMVADSILRRMAQYNGPLAPSHAVLVVEPGSNYQAEIPEVPLTSQGEILTES